MKKECSDVCVKRVSQDFYQAVLELSASNKNQVMRLAPDVISSLIDTAECFPGSYIQNVFKDVKTALTGDVYISRIGHGVDDNLVLLAVRDGECKNSGRKVMKTDTFVIKVNNGNAVDENMYACYHLDCTGRYNEPTEYSSLRDSLSVGMLYDCEDTRLSSLMCPIRKGIEETNKRIGKVP